MGDWKETQDTGETKPQPEANPRFGETGKQAMQGLEGALIDPEKAKPHLNPETTKEVESGLGANPAWSDDPDGLSPVLDDSQLEKLSLQERHRRGVDYAVMNAEVSEGGLGAYRKMAGSVGEGVYLSANGSSVGAVNDLNMLLGNHNKLFDGSSSEELVSIKTYVTGRSEPYGRYARGLREMIGEVESKKLDSLSQELWALKTTDPEKWSDVCRQLPPGIKEATEQAELRQRMVDDAVMRIPADQVEPAQAYIVRAATKRPELYGLDPNLAPADLKLKAHLLAGKIKPLAPDVTAHDIRLMTGHAYRHRFED